MNRKEELLKIFEEAGREKELVAVEVIENVIFLEGEISKLRQLPQISIHPDMPELQKRTEASKMLIPYMQQYNICIKFLSSLLIGEEVEGDGLEVLKAFSEKVKNL